MICVGNAYISNMLVAELDKRWEEEGRKEEHTMPPATKKRAANASRHSIAMPCSASNHKLAIPIAEIRRAHPPQKAA